MRVEHLRKPLVDLRLDLANLHDGMVSRYDILTTSHPCEQDVFDFIYPTIHTLSHIQILLTTTMTIVSSMRTIEDKLQNREEVVSRRRMLEAMLACMEKLDLAEEVVLFANQVTQPNGATGKKAFILVCGCSNDSNPHPHPSPLLLICCILFRTFSLHHGDWRIRNHYHRSRTKTKRSFTFVCSITWCHGICNHQS